MLVRPSLAKLFAAVQRALRQRDYSKCLQLIALCCHGLRLALNPPPPLPSGRNAASCRPHLWEAQTLFCRRNSVALQLWHCFLCGAFEVSLQAEVPRTSLRQRFFSPRIFRLLCGASQQWRSFDSHRADCMQPLSFNAETNLRPLRHVLRGLVATWRWRRTRPMRRFLSAAEAACGGLFERLKVLLGSADQVVDIDRRCGLRRG